MSDRVQPLKAKLRTAMQTAQGNEGLLAIYAHVYMRYWLFPRVLPKNDTRNAAHMGKIMQSAIPRGMRNTMRMTRRRSRHWLTDWYCSR